MDDVEGVETLVAAGQIEYHENDILIEGFVPPLEMIVRRDDLETCGLESLHQPFNVRGGASDYEYVLTHERA